VQEGEEPLALLSGMIATHSQVVSGWQTILDAYTLTCALPASFGQQKQTLWARNSITSAYVMSTIRAEWHKRNMEQSAAANFAKTARLDTNSANIGKTCHFHPHLVNNC
jgi:uncharacterized protein (DUF2132 family)